MFLKKRKTQEQIKLGVEYFFFFAEECLAVHQEVPVRISERKKKEIRDAFFQSKDIQLEGWLKMPKYGLMFFIKVETAALDFVNYHLRQKTSHLIRECYSPKIDLDNSLVKEVRDVIIFWT